MAYIFLARHFGGRLAWNLEILGVSSAWDVHGMLPGFYPLHFSLPFLYFNKIENFPGHEKYDL